MSRREKILQQALSLPPEDRAYIIAELEWSLEGHSPDSEALVAELHRRSEAYRTGATTARPVEEVMAELRERQSVEQPPH